MDHSGQKEGDPRSRLARSERQGSSPAAVLDPSLCTSAEVPENLLLLSPGSRPPSDVALVDLNRPLGLLEPSPKEGEKLPLLQSSSRNPNPCSGFITD